MPMCSLIHRTGRPAIAWTRIAQAVIGGQAESSNARSAGPDGRRNETALDREHSRLRPQAPAPLRLAYSFYGGLAAESPWGSPAGASRRSWPGQELAACLHIETKKILEDAPSSRPPPDGLERIRLEGR